MAAKQLIIAVEGTAAMGPFWNTIVADYLEKIIRCFYGNELSGQKTSPPNIELSLVMFNAHGSCCACLVQRSGWTRDIDIFLQWLSALPFAGGDFSDAAIAEGLAEALMMFSIAPSGSQTQQTVDGQKHCILIAASNPYPLPTPVYRPQMQNLDKSENIEAQTESRLSDAETVAKSFAQCSVSLSVISPKLLPKLRAIYNAGKCNPRAADPPVDNVKNRQFLVLISENFMEARSALSRPGITGLASNQSPVKMDIPSVPAVSVPPPTSIPAGTLAGTAQVTQNSALGSFTSATSNMSGNSNLGISQPLGNLQGGVTIGQSVPGMSQGNLSGAQMVQSGIGMNQNMISGLGPSSMSSGSGTMIPTPGMPQQGQPGMQSLGANNNSAANMALSQQTPSALQSAQSKYVKVWEGNLCGQRQGQPVFITRLEGFRSASASETLAANWPPSMQIVRLISQDHMNNKQYVGKADFLVFRAMNQHGFLGQLQEKKLCAVIQLPSQTLLLSVSDKACRLIGMLFPGDMVAFKPRISGRIPVCFSGTSFVARSTKHARRRIYGGGFMG